MYNQSYEDYMRNVLGYPMNDSEESCYRNTNNEYITEEKRPCPYSGDIEKMYPDIYRIVFPMVEKTLDENTEVITSETIERFTTKIFMSIEVEEKVEVKRDPKVQNTRVEENRQSNNSLRDLIRILILREIFDRNPIRPPHPGPGPRPPFPPFPGPGPRPPFPPHPGPGPRPPFPPHPGPGPRPPRPPHQAMQGPVRPMQQFNEFGF